jgi:hypothetical protein
VSFLREHETLMAGIVFVVIGAIGLFQGRFVVEGTRIDLPALLSRIIAVLLILAGTLVILW